MIKEAQIRKWRLVVRNCSFDCTEDDLKSTFSEFGNIHEIVMPQKNNRFAGFCFIQYEKRQSATQALKLMNGQEIKGRTIAVDWAIPKDQYMTAVIEEKQKAKSSQDEPKVLNQSKRRKIEDAHDEDTSSSENDAEESGIESKGDKIFRKADKSALTSFPKKSDVADGRTLFIRGLPFVVDNEQLDEAFSKFGPLKYALVCRFKDSTMSKGSGFVQFETKEAADACLAKAASETGIVLQSRRLTVCLAVAKSEADSLVASKAEKAQEPKDKRNLHLLRLGLVRQGTSGANGMSASDASKRLRIEATNRRKIKNLNIFVSPTRLVFHNLPTKIDEKQLRRICHQAVGDQQAQIKECRIMRDMDRTDSLGNAKSLGYAFIEFDQHEHALKCLEQLNNNPNTFTDTKRPIVEFSLENRLALNTKAVRLEKSRENLKKKPVTQGSFVEPPSKKHKMLFKPNVVPPKNANAPRKPFPSHMGPKIRTKQRRTKNRNAARKKVSKKQKA